MSDLLGQLDDLVSDEASQAEYRHEIAISAFTNEVARVMTEHGVSQAELARRLGVSRARVSQLLQHTSSPTLRTMVEVAAALGCDVSPVVSPRGFRPVRLCVADGGKAVPGYRQTRRLDETLRGRKIPTDRVAV